MGILMFIAPIQIAGNEMFHLIFAGFTTLVFSGFIAYDTTVMIDRIKDGEHDPFFHAINIFLDIINILIEIIKILIILKGYNDDSDDKSKDRKK
jgi:FtsH-binding integral membrane protein